MGAPSLEWMSGFCVSPRPHTLECQGCGLSTAASRALIPEMWRNAPQPPALIRPLGPKPGDWPRLTQLRESSPSVPLPRAHS